MVQRLQRYFVCFNAIRNKVGMLEAVKYALKRLWSGRMSPVSRGGESVLLEHYGFVRSRPFGVCGDSSSDRTINWVIPDFGIGSGGHLNVFRVIKHLEEKGFICRINIDGETHFSSGEEAKKCIREHFFSVRAEVGIGRDALRPAAATFATSWTTAYTVRDYAGAGKRYYFVQDFEPYFYAPGSEYAFAEQTYRFGFKGITAGEWLAEKLHSEYGMETVPFRFSYDRDLYRPYERHDPSVKRVFFYARPVTPRRAFELGVLALARVHEKRSDVKFVLAGWDLSGYELPFPYLNAGVVPLKDLPGLYSQCDIALILSMTNASLLPLEVMACNCAVVSNRGRNVEWLLNDKVSSLCEATPEALGDAIIQLLGDEAKLNSLKQSGLDFALSTDWGEEVEKIAREIERDLSSCAALKV